MKSKKLIIIGLIISSFISLYGCSSSTPKETSPNETSSNEDNTTPNADSTDTEKTQESADSSQTETKQTQENSNSTKTETKPTQNNAKKTQENDSNKTKPTKETTSTQKETNTKNENSTATSDITYNSTLGFSMKFPSSWKDRFTIKQGVDSISVYFKSSDPNTPKNIGLFFVIMKNTPEDEDHYDSIGVDKHFTVGDKTYFVGGPTDSGLDENNKDFKLFLSMNKDRKKIIESMKPL